MTFKTWEKIYWAIIGFLFALSCLPLFDLGTVNGKKLGEEISHGAYFGYLVLWWVVVFGTLWLIIRLIVNKGWEDKGKGKNRKS
ncbi:MAG: hypothetical protein I3273_02260 [Candidatus Moeniiplasma glomeromycotorum]|nr:hypothetical protein [Candidatus Moeniiplasma glomeromycotorum]MCE8167059.1 hypothetical protein [Candidatus Moeniiplasma glomeromycotorum]MCE8168929.1 hypothetical protein [Candidatus Moeniiplasma glomeromycotorum]